MKRFTKILSVILCVLTVLSSMSILSFAEAETVQDGTAAVQTVIRKKSGFGIMDRFNQKLEDGWEKTKSAVSDILIIKMFADMAFIPFSIALVCAALGTVIAIPLAPFALLYNIIRSFK